jgi:hypothetical protein
MPGKLQPLTSDQPIINPDGTPTLAFIRWAQQRQIDIGDGITEEEANALIQAWSAGRAIIAGTGLSGGGTLDEDRTINLEDTAVTPDTYGSSTKVAKITVDQQGRIIDAEEVTISGGGGGGSDLLGYAYSHTAVNLPSNTTPEGGLITDMSVTFDMPDDGLIAVQWSMLTRRNGGTVRILPFLDGVAMPRANANSNYYQLNQGENGVYQGNFTQIYECLSGTHTVTLNYADAQSVDSTDFWDRSLIVRKVA